MEKIVAKERQSIEKETNERHQSNDIVCVLILIKKNNKENELKWKTITSNDDNCNHVKNDNNIILKL